MSIKQAEPFLVSAPRVRDIKPDHPLYVFHYGDHFDWSEFASKVPGSLVFGIGTLRNWTWHINELGVPNIRRNFMSSSDNLLDHHYVTPAPAVVASNWKSTLNIHCLGWIMQVKASDDDLVNQILGKKRVRVVVDINTTISTTPLRTIEVAAIAYWDPRHTQDFNSSAALTVDEANAWKRGLGQLQIGGVSRQYLHKLQWTIGGRPVTVEPLLICPAQLATKGMDLRRRQEVITNLVPPRQRVRLEDVASHSQGGVRMRENGVIRDRRRPGVRATMVTRGMRELFVVDGIRLNKEGKWEKIAKRMPSLVMMNFIRPPASRSMPLTPPKESSPLIESPSTIRASSTPQLAPTTQPPAAVRTPKKPPPKASTGPNVKYVKKNDTVGKTTPATARRKKTHDAMDLD